MEAQRSRVSIALCVVGLCVSLYLVYQHYSGHKSSLCEMSSIISCSKALLSEYATLLGVPVAIHGAAYFVVALGAAILNAVATETRARRDASCAFLAVAGVGALSSLYFIYAEIVLGSICPMCTVVHVITFVMVYLGYKMYLERAAKWPLSAALVGDVFMNRIYWIALASVIVLAPVVVFGLPAMAEQWEDSRSGALAKCLSERGAQMFGAHTCGHCVAQKGRFGSNKSRLPYVECLEEKDRCKQAKVNVYPTWVLGDKRNEGVMELTDLAIWSGCESVLEGLQKKDVAEK